MRRALLWSLLAVFALLLGSGFTVLLRVGRAAPLPPPDASLPIQLPDGATLPLGELLARLADDARSPPQPLRAADASPAADDARLAEAIEGLTIPRYPGMGWGPVFRLAEGHQQSGRIDQALALYQSIPEGHQDYGRAQRRIAWGILTLHRNDPAAGVPYARRALIAEPFDGNSWQDMVRVYGRTLGLPLD